MYGFSELKKTQLTSKTVPCPVLGCHHNAEKAKSGDKLRQRRFLCKQHHIYISPSTFAYENESDNILWGYDILQEHKADKRESRIARNNSEDALTWNVFRFMENAGLLIPWLSGFAYRPVRQAETMFWSYRREEHGAWSLLDKARSTFGEAIGTGSEPDLIVYSASTLFFIEAKYGSGNNTTPSAGTNRKQLVEKYRMGGQGWFSQVFKGGTDFGRVAYDEKSYELSRLWLLGTWIANELGADFRLLNLVCDDEEKAIVERFGIHLAKDAGRKFVRTTWEGIYQAIVESDIQGEEVETIRRYFEEKTDGYKSGALQRAFNLRSTGR